MLKHRLHLRLEAVQKAKNTAVSGGFYLFLIDFDSGGQL
jgi:hypothetical protein